MSREEKINKLKQAVDQKRKQLGLTEKDTEQYAWLADLLRMQSKAKGKATDALKRDTNEPRNNPIPHKKFDGYA